MKKLRRIELLYGPTADANHDAEFKAKLRYVRSQVLREYVTEKRTEFASINEQLAGLLFDLFESLYPEYQSQKTVFKLRGF